MKPYIGLPLGSLLIVLLLMFYHCGATQLRSFRMKDLPISNSIKDGSHTVERILASTGENTNSVFGSLSTINTKSDSILAGVLDLDAPLEVLSLQNSGIISELEEHKSLMVRNDSFSKAIESLDSTLKTKSDDILAGVLDLDTPLEVLSLQNSGIISELEEYKSLMVRNDSFSRAIESLDSTFKTSALMYETNLTSLEVTISENHNSNIQSFNDIDALINDKVSDLSTQFISSITEVNTSLIVKNDLIKSSVIDKITLEGNELSSQIDSLSTLLSGLITTFSQEVSDSNGDRSDKSTLIIDSVIDNLNTLNSSLTDTLKSIRSSVNSGVTILKDEIDAASAASSTMNAAQSALISSSHDSIIELNVENQILVDSFFEDQVFNVKSINDTLKSTANALNLRISALNDVINDEFSLVTDKFSDVGVKVLVNTNSLTEVKSLITDKTSDLSQQVSEVNVTSHTLNSRLLYLLADNELMGLKISGLSQKVDAIWEGINRVNFNLDNSWGNSQSPTPGPTNSPTLSPTDGPTISPTSGPPTVHPTRIPTCNPTIHPSAVPSAIPTVSPSNSPTVVPTLSPSNHPTANPTKVPTRTPSQEPSASPTTSMPTVQPSKNPTQLPSKSPTVSPSQSPTTSSPTQAPADSSFPTSTPTSAPSALFFHDDPAGHIFTYLDPYFVPGIDVHHVMYYSQEVCDDNYADTDHFNYNDHTRAYMKAGNAKAAEAGVLSESSWYYFNRANNGFQRMKLSDTKYSTDCPIVDVKLTSAGIWSTDLTYDFRVRGYSHV